MMQVNIQNRLKTITNLNTERKLNQDFKNLILHFLVKLLKDSRKNLTGSCIVMKYC